MKKSLFALVMGAGFLLSSQAFAACGKTQVAEMNWASGQVLSQLTTFILREGYGCDAEIVGGSTVPTATAMSEKGEPHINPEMWINSVKEIVEGGVSKGHFTDAGDIFSDGGLEAWWVPAYMSETHPDIKSIHDVLGNPQVFKDPEDPGKGRFYTCPSGWACRIINGNLAKAYGLDQKFNIFDTGSGESLKASIAKAHARKEPWVGYYWGPTAVLGKFPMKRLQMDPHDATGHLCNQKENCDNPHAGQYPVARVMKLVVKDWEKENKAAAKFVKKMSIPNDVVNAVLAWREDNQADGNETAGYFMATYPKLWKKWMPSKVVRKIQAKL